MWSQALCALLGAACVAALPTMVLPTGKEGTVRPRSRDATVELEHTRSPNAPHRPLPLLSAERPPPPPSQLPDCECDVFTNGMDNLMGGDHACMFWNHNNPFRETPSDWKGLPEQPAANFQMGCAPVQKGIRTGRPEERLEGWQGNCPQDHTKCVVRVVAPTWKVSIIPRGPVCRAPAETLSSLYTTPIPLSPEGVGRFLLDQPVEKYD